MNYYLVNYIVLENKNVIVNDRIGITLQAFGNINDFKNIITRIHKTDAHSESVVIQSYKQVYKEEYYEFTSVMK